MQGLITIFYMVTLVSSPQALSSNNSVYGHSDILPETVVTAPRNDIATVGHIDILPEVIVTATKTPIPHNTDLAQTRYANYEIIKNRVYKFSSVLKPNFAYAKPVDDVEAINCGKTSTGNFTVAAGDTIKEDMTVTGGDANIDGVIDGDLAVMGGSVDINGQVDGDVAVFGGNLDINGTITGDAAVFGGQVQNNTNGNIEGDLAVIGGTVELDSGSAVKGDINMVGGTVDRDTNAVVLGKVEAVEMKALEKLLPRISKLGRTFKWSEKLPGSNSIPGIVGIAICLVAYVINLLALLIFPKAIDKVTEKIQSNTWTSVGCGIGLQILFIPLVILFAVSIIGIPLIPVFVLAIFVAALFGSASLSLIIGEKIIKGFNSQINNRIGTFTIGYVAIRFIMILGFILAIFGLPVPPIFVIGLTITYVAISIGIGGVIFALIKRARKTNNV